MTANSLNISTDQDMDMTPAETFGQFDADGTLLRLVSEARRIQLAHLFDPYLALHISAVEPLPHQITAVYEQMLPRQPLKYLLADDPGAGKTIMAGLLIKELIVRGDVRRCLIVCPGSLVEQWQLEMERKFALSFEILTRTHLDSADQDNICAHQPLLIGRLDQLARSTEQQAKLRQTEWDLIICDEAHKMSASFFGREVRYTKRYRLGQLLSGITRHFLLLTATPHNGKEEEFQLFMALLDRDRFAERFQASDVSGLMRRMVKEKLVKFDGHPLFPERRAYTLPYRLSAPEDALYQAVTAYVREEFNKAEQLQDDGQKSTVGFALTILQRRLASSPAAISRSLTRRRARLERRLDELLASAQQAHRSLDAALLEDPDLPTAAEIEETEDVFVDQATAATTLAGLQAEIDILKHLEQLARRLRQAGTDRKWEELSGLLQNQKEMFDAQGKRRKLVVFTEHKDTLSYLVEKIRVLLGRVQAVTAIHGTVSRQERLQIQEAFTHDPTVQVLVATDAAGEGINLQAAHLMVNYDLPWNPNRLEQRFGRIHRIGQTQVCHLWNLVAHETREGDVYLTLLNKLEQERETLGGAVFDVLGKAIDGKALRRLMVEAIRYGDRATVQAKIQDTLAAELDTKRLQALTEDNALAPETMDISRVHQVREAMERMQARRLQPHYIASFFKDAFVYLCGELQKREKGRYEIPHVPQDIRKKGRQLASATPLARRYARICFEKEHIDVVGKPQAAFICPGHPLLDATIALLLERHQDVLRRGAVLVDEQDCGIEPRVLFYLEHRIQDGGGGIVSRRMQFVEMPLSLEDTQQSQTGEFRNAGYAPYLDYRPLAADEADVVWARLRHLKGARPDLEQQAIDYASRALVPIHRQEVEVARWPLIDKTRAAVKARLTSAITYWDRHYEELRLQGQAGKVNARRDLAQAHRRREELKERLAQRMAELDQERTLVSQPPQVPAASLVVPIGLLRQWQDEPLILKMHNRAVEMATMHAVMAAEQNMGHRPMPVYRAESYDIISWLPDREAGPRIIEVKGVTAGSNDIVLTRNEKLTALNQRENWWLALVRVPSSSIGGPGWSGVQLEDNLNAGKIDCEVAAACQVRYVPCWFTQEPEFGSTGEKFSVDFLWERGYEV